MKDLSIKTNKQKMKRKKKKKGQISSQNDIFHENKFVLKFVTRKLSVTKFDINCILLFGSVLSSLINL